MIFDRNASIGDMLAAAPGVKAVGEKLMFQHTYDAGAAMQNAYHMREFSDNGWTPDRDKRQIASIPVEKFTELSMTRPEIVKDAKALLRWIDSDEGAPYRTVKRRNTGRSGKAIVR